jgi:AcrR family transcriptional regulator
MSEARQLLIAAATPFFAAKGINGTNVREIANAAGVNLSMISYHFGSKEGLYAAVLREQFAGLTRIAAMVGTGALLSEKFATYLYECGVCFHCGTMAEFVPKTAGANREAPECPRCLTNDASVITPLEQRLEKAS